MDLLDSFSKLHFSTKRILINIFVVFVFWTIPFIVFKPEILEMPIYVQFFLVTAFTILWIIIGMIYGLLLGILNIFSIKDSWFLEQVTFLSILFLCFYILIGYYYSVCFTDFIKIAFISSVPISLGVPTIGSAINLIAGRNKTRENKNL